MITITKKLPNSQVLLTVEVPKEVLVPYEEEAAKLISERVKIPGFRQGQAPKYIVISHVGAERFFEEAVNRALPDLYLEAVKKEGLEPISPPRVKITNNDPVTFEAEIALFPEIKIKGIEKLKVPVEKVAVDDKEIDEVINQLLRYHATYTPLERPVKKGDRLEIDFKGFDKGGAELESTASKNHPLFVGEGTLIPGFEDELVEMKVGETKKFPLIFPKDYHHKPFQKKQVTFEVTIQKGDEVMLPELTEEFIEKILGAKKTAAELREAVQSDIKGQKDKKAREERENKLFDTLLDKASLDLPPLLVDEEVEYMMVDLKKRIEQQGGDFKMFLEQLEKQGNDPMKEYRPEAEKRVKLRLVLNHLFRTLPIEVSDEEMKKAEEKLLASVPAEQKAEIEKELKQKRGVFARLQNNLALEKLMERFLKEE
ncbi:trigger factor [Candidatus Peregrinibacteria bacterium CG_4_9_14_0_2_um_filter_53_11]|nr:MAG: trigger factor [Candidatus Peregrinibacteria bacterium CG_4_9_14_0_2_um_filter_53_11]